ncbi:MAG: endonuclease/exonuclease/phosphatase family protein [Deltaproteobacteria bacterium]|nr:endonuclease/exonuclease/phosphatase family protein [Deltaproteobacteria bacterium]
MNRFLALVVLVFGFRLVCQSAEPSIRIATFNIEDFPKDDRQIAGAFTEISALEAPIVGVQEIMDPRRFEHAMRERLGADWQVTFEPFEQLGYRHTGVLFDRSRFALVSSTFHDETKLDGRNKGVLEVRLRPEAGGAVIRVLVVHLKAGGDGREIRARQHEALAGIVAAANRSGDRVVVLGDFNATHDVEDRADLAKLAATSGLHWSTESLACSAFWRREDGCPRSRLDHVVAWSAGTVSVAGACATDGCDWENSCPLYSTQISDHCPVIVDLD